MESWKFKGLLVAFLFLHVAATAQSWLWSGHAISNGNEVCRDIAVDLPNNRVFTVGEFDDNLLNIPGNPGPDLTSIANGIIIVTDTGGNYLNHTRIRSSQSMTIGGCALDNQGNLYVTGSFADSAEFVGNGAGSLKLYSLGARRVFLAKFSPGLNGIWAVCDSTSPYSIGNSVTWDNGHVVLGGAFEGAISFDTIQAFSRGNQDAFVASFDGSLGSIYWMRSLGGSGVDQILSVDAGQFFTYVGGYFESDTLFNDSASWFGLNQGMEDAFLASFRIDSGFYIWAQTAGGAGHDRCEGVSMEYYDLFATGSYEGSASFPSLGSLNSVGLRDAFLWRLDRVSGTPERVRSFGGVNDDVATDVDVDEIHNVYVTGYFTGNVNFGSGGLVSLSSTGSLAVARYRNDLNFDGWSGDAQNTDGSMGMAVTAGASGVYVGGMYINDALQFTGSAFLPSPTSSFRNYVYAKVGCGNLVNPLPTITLGDDTLCSPDFTTITISSTDANYYYAFRNYFTNELIGPVVPGNNGPLVINTPLLTASVAFDVIVIDSVSKCYDIIFPYMYIAVGYPTAFNLGNDTTICLGDNLPIGVAGMASYSWNVGSSSPFINVSATGTYILTAKNIFLCESSDTIVITTVLKPSGFVNDTATCAGVSFPFTAQGAYTFLWSTGTIGPTAVIPDSGTYWCQANNMGCIVSDTFRVFGLPDARVDITGDSIGCQGDSLQLLAVSNDAVSYIWSTGVTANTISVTSPGLYIVDITSSFGCKDIDSILVSIQANPLVVISPIQPIFCESDSGVTAIASPAGGIWSGAVSSAVIDPQLLGPGNHTIEYRYTDSIGCFGLDSVQIAVIQLPSSASAGPDQTLYVNQGQILANTPSVGSGVWTTPGASTIANPNLSISTVTGLVPGPNVFVYEVVNAPCPSSSDTMVIQFIQLNTLNIPSGFSPNNDGLNDSWVVQNILNYPKRDLQIFNRWGQKLIQFDQYQNDWQGLSADGKPLSDDTYYYTLDLGDYGVHNGYIVLKR